MAGVLYVVATPLGNLEDITLRALRVLSEVALVLCEDTRRTAKLLTSNDIRVRTRSFHEHNARRSSTSGVRRLAAGDDLALVSDERNSAWLELRLAHIDRDQTVFADDGLDRPGRAVEL